MNRSWGWTQYSKPHVVAGQYDVIAEVQGEEVYSVIHAVATDLTSLDGVVDTRTYICLE